MRSLGGADNRETIRKPAENRPVESAGEIPVDAQLRTQGLKTFKERLGYIRVPLLIPPKLPVIFGYFPCGLSATL